MRRKYHHTEKRFMVVARHYPDLDPSYDGPALSLEDQCEGVLREWPVLYATRLDAETQMAWLKVRPDPSFCHPDDKLSIVEIAI